MFQHSLFRDFFINMIEACGGGRHCLKFGHLVVYVHLNRTIQVFVQTPPLHIECSCGGLASNPHPRTYLFNTLVAKLAKNKLVLWRPPQIN